MLLLDTKYIPVRQYDVDQDKASPTESPTDTDDSNSPLNIELEERPKTATRSIHRWEWVTCGLLALLSIVFFTLWVTSTGAQKCPYVVKYSPANEAIEYIEHFKYKGSLNFTTPWRGDESGNPSPHIDAAWRRISTDIKPIRITEEQLHQMGMEVTPTTVKLSEEEGAGYLASLEVTHHLHCLDMLRKATYREYYGSFDPAFQIEDEILMNQLDTCVELIRQALMCYPDLNMVMYYWVRGFHAPFGDSNTIHRCKNFDKILHWASEKAVDVPHIRSSLEY
ncbi:protein of unknown function (DUF3328) domain containing protein [Tylopilus felleus]